VLRKCGKKKGKATRGLITKPCNIGKDIQPGNAGAYLRIKKGGQNEGGVASRGVLRTKGGTKQVKLAMESLGKA